MSEPFIGEIRMVAFNFAPRGWALCNGQLLSIRENQALFSLIGTTYGGDGRTTFALPDLRGRVPLHTGQGQGVSHYRLGSRGGQEQVSLGVEELPVHQHQLLATSAEAVTEVPQQQLLANTEQLTYAEGNADVPMHSTAIGSNGGSQPHENRQPFLTLNFVIALEGIFPPRGLGTLT